MHTTCVVKEKSFLKLALIRWELPDGLVRSLDRSRGGTCMHAYMHLRLDLHDIHTKGLISILITKHACMQMENNTSAVNRVFHTFCPLVCSFACMIEFVLCTYVQYTDSMLASTTQHVAATWREASVQRSCTPRPYGDARDRPGLG